MLAERAPWDSAWQTIAEYILPRQAAKSPGPNLDASSLLFDSTAVQANQTLANGMLDFVTPADGQWFTFRSASKNDKVDAWLQECTEVIKKSLANSNFYTQIHELYFDDAGFGTTCLLALEGKSSPVFFTSLPRGTFCLAEDDEELIDTCFREIKLTPRQAALKFGEENLSSKLQEELKKFRQSGGPENKHTILHAMYPRPESERKKGKEDGPNKPYASVYVEVQQQHVISNGGFDEKAFFAGRHLKNAGDVYGYSPSFTALPDARQLNFLVQQLDALAEVKAFPRMLLPYDFEGEIDVGASGRTYFDPNKPADRPVEWMTQGDYNIGLDREKRKEEAINRAYHVDVFQMFASLDKQMTAREVAERSSEKVLQFSPAFARKTTELLTPLLRRVFGIHARKGLLPNPPPEAATIMGAKGPEVPLPDIAYNSKAAIAVSAFYNLAFESEIEMLVPLIQVRPELLDNFDLDVITRESSRNRGVPANWITALQKMEEARAARAQAIAQQQQAEQAALMAKAAGDAGKVMPDSVVGQQLQK